MTFHDDYKKARDNIMGALGLGSREARHWLVRHVYVVVTPAGKVVVAKPSAELVAKLAGPHGIAFITIMDIREKEHEKQQ